MDFPKPLDCSSAGSRETLLALLQHKLDEEHENRVLRHLRKCPHCLSTVAMIIDEARPDPLGDDPAEDRKN